MEKVKELAAQYQQAGNNCAETVVKVCNDCLDLKLPPETLRMVSVLGGGVAGSGCICGALNGACLVLGCLAGRTTPEERRKPKSISLYGNFRKSGSTALKRRAAASSRVRTMAVPYRAVTSWPTRRLCSSISFGKRNWLDFTLFLLTFFVDMVLCISQVYGA